MLSFQYVETLNWIVFVSTAKLQQSSTCCMEPLVFKDSAGVDVDADIIDELVRTSKVSLKFLGGDNDKSFKKLMTCCHVHKCII